MSICKPRRKPIIRLMTDEQLEAEALMLRRFNSKLAIQRLHLVETEQQRRRDYDRKNAT